MTPHQVNRCFLKQKNWIYNFLFFYLMVASTLQAQGLRGLVQDIEGKPLPFAAVFFPDLKVGASTNADGHFDVRIPPGNQTVVVQFLGFQTLKAQVAIPDTGFIEQTFVLYPQTTLLREAEIGAKREDPAVAVMRQAIAKAKFHLLQYDSYTCRVYTKGSGLVEKAPRIIAKQLREDGWTPGETYTSESLIEVKFEQPNKISERVIAISERADKRGPNPAPYINQSFYNPYVSGAISPLSPAAFYYYKFFYLGGFEENGRWVNKIRVIPKSTGEQVFQGDLMIIEDTWAIHSLDFTTYLSGFKLEFSQLHSPVVADVWMPIKHKLKFSGEVLGVKASAEYHAVVSNYNLVLNAQVMAAAAAAQAQVPDLDEPVAASKASAKAYKNAAKKVERDVMADQDQAIVSERNYVIDSLARKQDPEFWTLNRPIPLTAAEQQGYKNADSLVAAEIADSNLTAPGNKFKVLDLLGGNRYKLGHQTRFTLRPTWTFTEFNSVEGLVVQMKGSLDQQFGLDNPWRMELRPNVRYGFAEERLRGTLYNKWVHRNDLNSYFFEVGGGSMVRQFNADLPIHPIVNSLYTLFARQNFLKLYHHDFVEARFYRNFNKRWELEVQSGVYQRRALDNTSDYSFFYRERRQFTSNLPHQFTGVAAAELPHHTAANFQLKLDYRPNLKYRIRNGKLLPNANNANLLTLVYHKGFYSTGSGFDHLQLRFSGEARLRISGVFSWVVSGGTFFNTQPYFPDWAHFSGNQTLFAPIGKEASYRTLPYYDFSTAGPYLSQEYHYTFRKLLLSLIPQVRLLGVKEQVFCNVLMTNALQNRPFIEVGYSADRIYRFFRFEVAYSNRVDVPGFRVGLSSLIQID